MEQTQTQPAGHDDLALFKRALQVEVEKRAAILSADGRELQRKTKESEEIMRQVKATVERRKGIDQTELSPEARRVVTQLRDETDENQRLLQNANRTIHNLLTDMGDQDRTYSPNKSRSAQTGGVLLDASV